MFPDHTELQLYLNPQTEHLLDWFHVSMRQTVMWGGPVLVDTSVA
jgi:hypothetical protein